MSDVEENDITIRSLEKLDTNITILNSEIVKLQSDVDKFKKGFTKQYNNFMELSLLFKAKEDKKIIKSKLRLYQKLSQLHYIFISQQLIKKITGLRTWKEIVNNYYIAKSEFEDGWITF